MLSQHPSDHRRDRIAKVVEYAAFGVSQYWIVDPAARTLELYQLRDGAYVRVAGACDGTLEVPTFDALSIDLDEIWSRLDRLGEMTDR